MPSPSHTYLDIETSLAGEITIIGLYTPGRGTLQLVRPDLDAPSLLNALAETEILKTYNGGRFDLPVIRHRLGVDLTCLFRHEDIMLRCWRQGLKGGLKAVERQLGLVRRTAEVDGWMAMRLWQAWEERGDARALERLLLYNREDVELLAEVEERLLASGDRKAL